MCVDVVLCSNYELAHVRYTYMQVWKILSSTIFCSQLLIAKAQSESRAVLAAVLRQGNMQSTWTARDSRASNEALRSHHP